MSNARYEDWRLLDLEPGADLAQVNRALHFRRSLYQAGALATYNLFEEEERLRMLDRIDEAYRRLTDTEPPPNRESHSDLASEDARAEAPSGPPPDLRLEPGAHLRYHRRTKGLVLEQLAIETKIRAVLLDQIESEAVDQLPAAVFVRGHVLQYARALGLPDPNEIAARYLAKVKVD